jgi:hypothetical protein
MPAVRRLDLSLTYVSDRGVGRLKGAEDLEKRIPTAERKISGIV